MIGKGRRGKTFIWQMTHRQKRILATIGPLSVPAGILAWAIVIIVDVSTSDDTGLASGLANDAASGAAALLILVDFWVVLPLALFVRSKLRARANRAVEIAGGDRGDDRR